MRQVAEQTRQVPNPGYQLVEQWTAAVATAIRGGLERVRAGSQDHCEVIVNDSGRRELAVGFLDPADDQAFIDRVVELARNAAPAGGMSSVTVDLELIAYPHHRPTWPPF